MGRPLSPTACCGAKPTLGVDRRPHCGGPALPILSPSPPGIPRLTQRPSIIAHIESAPGRELYFFALYRVLEAGILAGLLFSPLSGCSASCARPVPGHRGHRLPTWCSRWSCCCSGRQRALAGAAACWSASAWTSLVGLPGHPCPARGHRRHRDAAAVQRGRRRACCCRCGWAWRWRRLATAGAWSSNSSSSIFGDAARPTGRWPKSSCSRSATWRWPAWPARPASARAPARRWPTSAAWKSPTCSRSTN